MSEHLLAPSHPEFTRAAHIEVGDVMLVLGDSIAMGIGAEHVSAGCMAQVAASIAAHHPRLAMVNLAVPSESSASMLASGGQLDRAVEVIARAHDRRERVTPVTMSIGANDSIEASTLGEDEALRHFADNLESIFSRLATAFAGQQSRLGDVLCVQTFYNPFPVCGTEPGLPTADQLAPRRSRRHDFNLVVRDASARHGVMLVDIDAAFRGRELELTWLRTGDIHPTPAGQMLIRDAFLAVIRGDRP